jgi:hypothetical protein
MKTSHIYSRARQKNVKTDLPRYVGIRSDRLYFQHEDFLVLLLGDPDSVEFMTQYNDLLQTHGLLCEKDDRTVYFIAWAGGPVKIGISADIAARLGTLQRSCPYSLAIEATTSGGRNREIEYHEQFAACRLRGEWFARTPEIKAEIARLTPSSECCHGVRSPFPVTPLPSSGRVDCAKTVRL